jgi:hypothetical protein
MADTQDERIKEEVQKLLDAIASGVSEMGDWIDGQMDAGCTQDDETGDTVHDEDGACGCNGLVSWAKWQMGYDEYSEAMQKLRSLLLGTT